MQIDSQLHRLDSLAYIQHPAHLCSFLAVVSFAHCEQSYWLPLWLIKSQHSPQNSLEVCPRCCGLCFVCSSIRYARQHIDERCSIWLQNSFSEALVTLVNPNLQRRICRWRERVCVFHVVQIRSGDVLAVTVINGFEMTQQIIQQIDREARLASFDDLHMQTVARDHIPKACSSHLVFHI